MNRYQMWIVPNGQLTAAKTKTENSGIPGIAGEFSVKLRNKNGSNQTHNASAGWRSEEEAAFMVANLDPSFMVYEPLPGETPEHPLVTIDRLGYAMYVEPMDVK